MPRISVLILLATTITIYAEELKPRPDNPSIASQPGYVFDKDKLLDHFNDRRREFAKKNNRARMYKLEWDDDLAKKAIDQKYFCEACRYFYDMPKNKKGLESLETSSSSFFIDSKTVLKYLVDRKYVFGYNEVLLAGQKKVGCSVGNYNGNFDTKYGMMCLLSPEHDFESHFAHLGEAGSQCDGGLDNDDGLCGILPPSTTGSSNTTYFIIGGCVVVGGILLVVIVVVVFCILKRKKVKDQGSKTTGTATATGTTPTGTTKTGTDAPPTGRY